MVFVPEELNQANPCIRVDAVKKAYRGRKQPVLDGISFSVMPGETVGIVGPNGAGKTTLMLCLLGLQRPDSGTVRILNRKPDDIDVRRFIGYLPERLNFEAWLSGREFLTYHWQLAKCPPQSQNSEIEIRLSRSGLPQESWDRPVRTYSRGMLQRLGMAQALIRSPQILFLDEPTSGVDPYGAMEILDIIRALKKEGRTVLINSHQLDHLERVCDRVILVRNGTATSMEDLHLDRNANYALQVRWSNQTSNGAHPDLIKLADSCGARLLWRNGNQAKFEVRGDEGSTNLLETLLNAGFKVCTARPDSRLESLFKYEGEASNSD